MNDIELYIAEKGSSYFYLNQDGQRVGEMEFSVSDHHLTVYHTEVFETATGKGLGRLLLAAMVEYARNNHLQVIPLCPYVSAQFKKNKEEYADIWEPRNRQD